MHSQGCRHATHCRQRRRVAMLSNQFIRQHAPVHSGRVPGLGKQRHCLSRPLLHQTACFRLQWQSAALLLSKGVMSTRRNQLKHSSGTLPQELLSYERYQDTCDALAGHSSLREMTQMRRRQPWHSLIMLSAQKTSCFRMYWG